MTEAGATSTKNNPNGSTITTLNVPKTLEGHANRAITAVAGGFWEIPKSIPR